MFNCVTLKFGKICFCGLLLLSACVSMLAASVYNWYLAKCPLSGVARLSVLALPNASLPDVEAAVMPAEISSPIPSVGSSPQVTSTILPEVSLSMPSVGRRRRRRRRGGGRRRGGEEERRRRGGGEESPQASLPDVEAAVIPAEISSPIPSVGSSPQVTSTILPEVSLSMPSVGRRRRRRRRGGGRRRGGEEERRRGGGEESPLSIMPKCGYPGIRCSRKSPYRIYVSRKSYIFQQMSDAVIQGLGSRKDRCRYEVLDVDITKHSQYAGKVVRGDVWIHVGYSKQEVFYELCKEKFAPLKVYCIFFNSEPRKVKAPKGVCEIWDYTHVNQPIAPVVRYLPPGFVPVYKDVSENDLAVRKRSEECEKSKLELFFLGNVSKLRRKHCWNHLQRLPALQHLTFTSTDRGIRSLKAMRKLVEKRNTIFLNMHPLCNESAGSSYPSERLETVRLSVLLSFGALVISELANPVDMTLYQDIVIFEKNLFRAFSTWSPDLQELLGNCNKIREFQLQAYELFKQRFDPGLLLENAGILEIDWAIRSDSSTALRV